MEKQPKYILAEGVGEVRIFGTGTHYVMEGEESPTTVILTDEIAERLLETNPGTAEQIIPNPAYKETGEAAKKVEVKQEVAKPTKEPKAAKTPKEPKAKKAATVTEGTGLIAPVVSNEPDSNEGTISQDVVIPAV